MKIVIIGGTGFIGKELWRTLKKEHEVIVASRRKLKVEQTKYWEFMDIAVPRDVDADVKEVDGVRLFDMDTLTEQLETSLAQRKAEVPHVAAILAEECAHFVDYLATLDLLPLIIELRTQVNAIRQAEVDKAIRRIPDLSPETEQRIDALTKSIVQKILHNPTIRLREVACSSQSSDYADITRGLFGLD